MLCDQPMGALVTNHMTSSFSNRNFKQTWQHLIAVGGRNTLCNIIVCPTVVTPKSQHSEFTNDHLVLWIQVKVKTYIT